MSQHHRKGAGVLAAALGVTFSLTISARNAHAAGYELLEQSANGVGTAYAGASTGFGDGSEVYYNPAAMALLPKNTGSIGINLIMPHSEFNNEGSHVIPQLGGAPLVGNEGGDAGSVQPIPNIYGTYKVSEDLTLGLGINSPFGLESRYNNTWVGRYEATNSRLTTVNINPGVSYRLLDSLAIGANMQIMYADAKLSNAIDFGSIGVATLGVPTASTLGLLPQRADGFVDVTGDDWGVGMGLGGVFTPCENLTFGVNWRSRMQLDLEGDADFTVPQNAQALTSTGRFVDTNASAKVDTPESINAGMAAKLDDQWTLYADATWTRWARFDELSVQFDSPQPTSVTKEGWDNVWRYSVGTKYRPCEPWAFKLGFTYDQSPVSGAGFRTPRIPDNDRYWAAFGVDYDIDESWVVGFSYAHLFIPDASSHLVSNTSTLDGEWDSSVEIASLALNARF